MNTFIHLLHGKEENYHGMKTKSGCGLPANNPNIRIYVYYDKKEKVTCELCKDKILKIEKRNIK